MTKSETQAADYRREAATGLRTEIDLPPTPEPSPARVTLEFSGRLRAPPSQWPWELILSGACVVRIEPGESVRVVDERAELITQALTADRFAAAIAEADTLRAELSAGKRWRDTVSLDRNAIRADRDALKDRVAELESQLESVACRAADAEKAMEVAPAASGAAGTDVAEIARRAFDAGFGSSVEGFNGECAYEHIAPKESTFEGDGSERYEKLKRDSVAKIMSEPASVAANSPAVPVSSEPVAWGVIVHRDTKAFCVPFPVREAADHFVELNSVNERMSVVPLYAAPQPAPGWLTEEERSLIGSLEGTFQQNADALRSQGLHGHVDNWERKVKLFRSILARSTPPEVVLPECVFDEFSGCSAVHAWNICAADFRKALAAAGVPVKEVGRE